MTARAAWLAIPIALGATMGLVAFETACGSRSPTHATGDASTDGMVAVDASADVAMGPEAPGDDGGFAEAGDGALEGSPPLEAGPPMPPPVVTYLGGPILTSPKVVTMTFAGDDPALVARLQLFDDTIASTPWWTAVSSEYCTKAGGPCVGPGAGGGHVVLPAAAPGYTDSIKGGDSTLRALLQSSVAAGALPALDAQTLLVLYLPAGSSVLLDGNASCQPASFASYHDEVALTPPDGGPPTAVAYAVIGRCSSTEAAATLAASHEIVESATDPSPEEAPAFQLTDQVWTAFGQEVADACAAVDTRLTAQESTFAVQRSWSNASAAAGHDPCVPVSAGESYFNAAPAQGTETLPLSVGESASIALYPTADGAMGPWQLGAVAASGSPLGFTVQPSTVSSGTRAVLTVTLLSQPALGVDQLYGIVSQTATDTHVWPMIVQAK
jgi:hypothetical protein